MRQVKELLAQLASGAQLCLESMKLHEAPECPEDVRRLSSLLAQRVGAGVGLSHFRGPPPLYGDQQLT